MSNPLDSREFKIYLDFKNQGSFGLVEITEPIGFDACHFVVKQDSNRYGRDVEYSNEEIDLQFQDIKTSILVNKYQLPNGVILDRLTMGLDFLLESFKIYGFESEVQLIVEKNGVRFAVCELDFQNADTDGMTYFNCVGIQITEKAKVKRRSDVVVDVLSNRDLDDNIASPIELQNVLLKAKPVNQISKWNQIEPLVDVFYSITLIGFTFPLGQSLVNFGIQDSFAPFDTYIVFNIDASNILADNKILRAHTNLTDVNIEIKGLNLKFLGDTQFTNVKGRLRIYYGTYPNYDDIQFIELIHQENVINVNQDYNINIPMLNSGSDLGIFFETYKTEGGNYMSAINMSYESITISATSTHIDSVIQGARHYDFMKSICQRLGNYNLIAPRFSQNGEFWNNIVFDGYRIRQFIDKPFEHTFKDMVDQLQELNCDYQILPNKNIFIGQYQDFYPNIEIDSFKDIPTEEFKVSFNERYIAQTFEYGYQEYEQDKGEEGTIDAVHTESQFMFPNQRVEGTKKVEVPYIRDSFKINSTQRENFKPSEENKNTSLQSDDSIFIVDVVPTANNQQSEIKRVLRFQVKNLPSPNIKILTDDSFSWNLVGLNVGDTLTNVTFEGETFTDLQVSEIEPSVLTLTRATNFDNALLGNKELFILLRFELNNVYLQNRTNQGFDLIENISNPENFSNLNYTIARNTRYWQPYLNTISQYHRLGTIKNTYFKTNGELITKLETESNSIKENADLKVSDLRERILTPRLIETLIIADFDRVLSIVEKMNTIENNQIGGFVRIADREKRLIKGYIKQLEYNWTSEELLLTLEEKYDSQINTISKQNGFWIINEVGYDSKIIGKELNYSTNGDYLQLFDYAGIPLTNSIRYDFYSVNGTTYSNIEALCVAIKNL